MNSARVRVAHLWTPSGVVDVAIGDTWPDLIAFGAWVYRPQRRSDLTHLVEVGRHSGRQVVEYKARFELKHLTDEERPRVLFANDERTHGYRHGASPDRPREAAHATGAPVERRRRERRHFSGGARERDAVRGR